jgi:steroid delta-isomerase-like uncharacterized protein
MSVSENIRLMKRWYQEVWEDKKDETIHELIAPDAEVHGHAPAPLRGPEQFMQFAHQIRGAFPDLKVTVEDIFGEGDKVAARWVASGTHRGEGFGPPSQKMIEVSGASIVQFKDGKIVAGWDNWDRLGMLEQIGAKASSSALSAA